MCIKRDEFFEDLGTDIDKAMSQRDFSITYSGRQAEVVGITDAIATGVFVFVIEINGFGVRFDGILIFGSSH